MKPSETPALVRLPVWFRIMVSVPALGAAVVLVWLAIDKAEFGRLWPIPFLFLGWRYANPSINMIDLFFFLIIVPAGAAILGGVAQLAGAYVSPHWWTGMWFGAPAWLATSFVLSFGMFLFGERFARIRLEESK